MRIYVASSWKNEIQPEIVENLRGWGQEVYDFKNPRPGDTGFSWSEIDEDWQKWSVNAYSKALSHPRAEAGFNNDFDAMRWAEAFVLVMPSGRSAHLEAGWAIGQGKPTCIFLPHGLFTDGLEPELMYKLASTIVGNVCELRAWVIEVQGDYQNFEP